TIDVIPQRRQGKPPNYLSNSTRAKIALWNSADMLIYNHFKSNFMTKLQEYGVRRMRREVARLRQRRRQIFEYCQMQYVSKSDENVGIFKAYHLDADGLLLPSAPRMRDPLCMQLTLPERYFTETLREKQLETIEFEEILKKLK